MRFVGRYIFCLTLSVVLFEVSCLSNAQLGVFASRVNGSEVTMCPTDDYTLIFECRAVGITSRWILNPIIGTPISLRSQENGTEITEDPVIVFLKRKYNIMESADYVFESLLYVPAEAIIAQESFPLTVACVADDIDRDEMFIKRLVVNTLPEILSARSIAKKWLLVEWSLVDNDAIVNIVIKVFSFESGSERSFAFESGKRDGIIPLETDAGLFNLTLVSIDTCGTEHSSAQYHVEIEEPVSTSFASIIKSVSESTPSFCPTVSSAPDQDCNPDSYTGYIAGLSVTIVLLIVVALVSVILGILVGHFWKRNKEKEEVSATNVQASKQQESELKENTSL